VFHESPPASPASRESRPVSQKSEISQAPTSFNSPRTSPNRPPTSQKSPLSQADLQEQQRQNAGAPAAPPPTRSQPKTSTRFTTLTHCRRPPMLHLLVKASHITSCVKGAKQSRVAPHLATPALGFQEGVGELGALAKAAATQTTTVGREKEGQTRAKGPKKARVFGERKQRATRCSRRGPPSRRRTRTRAPRPHTAGARSKFPVVCWCVCVRGVSYMIIICSCIRVEIDPPRTQPLAAGLSTCTHNRRTHLDEGVRSNHHV